MEDLQKLAKQKGFNLDRALSDGVSEQDIRKYLERLPDDKEKRSLLKRGFDAVFASEKTLGKAYAGAIFSGSKAQEGIDRANELTEQTQSALVKRIQEKRARGEDVSRLVEVLNQTSNNHINSFDINEGLNLTNRQVIGATIGTVADIASAGTFGKHAAGAKSFTRLTKPVHSAAAKSFGVGAKTAGQAFKQGFKRGAIQGGAIGAGAGAGASLQANNDNATVIGDTLRGGAIGGALGGVLEGVATRSDFLRPQKAAAKREKAIEQFKKGLKATKEKHKEKADKIIPELLDRGWWGTRKKLLEKAQRGVQLSGKEYEKLGELRGVVEIDGLLQQIDDEIASMTLGNRGVRDAASRHITSAQQIIDSGADLSKNGGLSALIRQTKQNIVLGLKQTGDDVASTAVSKIDDASINSLDDLSKAVAKATRSQGHVSSVNVGRVKALRNLHDDVASLAAYNQSQGMNPVAYQEELRQLAKGYGDVLFDSRKSQKTISDNSTLSQVKKVDSAIRDLLNTKNPDYKKINRMYHLTSELMDVLNETAQRKSGHEVINLINSVTTGSGAVGGGVIGGVPGAIVGGVSTAGLVSMLNSTWFNTLRAVQKNQVANKLLQMAPFERSQMLLLLQRQGAEALTNLGIDNSSDQEEE